MADDLIVLVPFIETIVHSSIQSASIHIAIYLITVIYS